MTVTVVGAGGHVGLPLAIVIAVAGHTVHGLDINAEGNKMIMGGCFPFLEEHGQEQLDEALASGRLVMTEDISVIGKSDVVIVIIGTPVDDNLNPRVDHLVRFFESAKPHLKDQLIVLRSTVSPGTTERLCMVVPEQIEQGLDIVFGPERVLQGKAIEEIKSLPQIIGAYTDKAYQRASDFFKTFISADTIQLRPIEAELAKLITNMSRYVSFALANEFHLICDTFDANAVKVIDAANKDYPRMKMPVPGPNVGGPCLYKDGWFLIERIPFGDLIGNAFRINEGMTMQIVQGIEKRTKGKKIGILGMTFKADNDDTRNSLSFKLRKQLNFRGCEPICVEPHLPGFAPMEDLKGCDAVILMTPHKQFKDLKAILGVVDNPECWLVDMWGFWPEVRHTSANGYFQSKEII